MLVEVEIRERNGSVARGDQNHQNWRLGTVSVFAYHGIQMKFFS